MRTSRVAGSLLAMALAGSVALSLTGCAGSVEGRPWPEGQGPAAVTPPPVAPEPGPGRYGGGPATRTVPPVEVGPTSEVPEGHPRRPVAAPDAGDSPATRPTTPAAPGPGGGIPAAGDRVPGPRAAAPAAPVEVAPLTADVLPDECLVRADALAGLLGTAPAAPASNAEVGRPDGSRARSCFAVGGSATVAVNVYTTNLTTPAGHLRAATGSRPLAGTGNGTTAALVETVGGPTMQLGTAGHLVTVAVAGRAPSDEQWRAAARSAVAALAR
ncbi:hypothetical protein ACLFMI_25985 [Pseudonocardia nantongensis]|uniref:hypothetical protein n=1 Tax=Pseudonocardia nantongensis TaxID=1181885 RepID=UPI00397DDC21